MAEQQDFEETVRLAIYSGYAASGRALGEAELADRAGVTVREVREALLRLAAGRHLVLDASGAVIMAHPFASIPLGFAVMGSSTLWWGGCAWDSFAIPHLVPGEPEVLVSTRCPGCGRALAWVVGRDGPPTGDAVAHFLVPMAHVWDDVSHHLRPPAAVLLGRLCGPLAGEHRQRDGLDDGSGYALAARATLVRRPARPRLCPQGAKPGARLLPRGGTQRAVLGPGLTEQPAEMSRRSVINDYRVVDCCAR
jgi:hypothetical protein